MRSNGKIKIMILPSKEFWDDFKKTPGALSSAESLAIIQIAALAPNGIAMELGVNKGKSAMSAAFALKDCNFVLVEPEFADEQYKLQSIWNILKTAEANNVLPNPYAGYSTEAIPLEKEYAYVFVDSGSHGDGLPMQEVKMLEDRMMIGGIIAFHDLFSQFTEVTEAYYYLISTGKYEEIKINWQEIFDYVKEHDLETNNNSWHLYPELPHPPNFVGALKRIK